MARYVVLAADLLTDEVREEIPFDQFSYTHALNGAGSFSATVPLSTPKFNKILRSTLDMARTAIYVVRDGVVQWGGILWATDADLEGDSVRCAGQGFWSYYQRQVIESTLRYSDVTHDQFQIVDGILDHVHLFTGGQIGVQAAWSALSGVKRTRDYWSFEKKNAGEAITQLSEVDDGFDFAVDVGGSLHDGFTRALNLSFPRRGRRTSLVFESGKNVRVLRWGLDGWSMANRVLTVGAGEGKAMLITAATNVAKLDTYPMLREVTTYKDVSVKKTLDGHARADLTRMLNGTESLEVEIVASSPDSQLGSFITGDEIRCRADEGFIDVDSWYRLISYTVTVGREGGESVKASLVPTEATGG